MKSLAKLFLPFIFTIVTKVCYAQYFASNYKAKNKTEKLVIAKIKALPEVKEWFKTAKRSDPDLLIRIPDPELKSTNPTDTYFSIQVGIGNFDMFRTNYYLYVNPKNLDIYYNDLSDESGSKLITLQQWRYWRSKPGFFSNHKWEHGNLVVLKD